MNTEKAFNKGRDAAFDTMEALGKQGFDGKHQNFAKDAIAGALKELMLVTYAMAPNEETAEELISLMQKHALEDWQEANPTA